MKILKFGKLSNGRKRFNFLGLKGLYAKRSLKSRGYGLDDSLRFGLIVHFGKRSFYFDKKGK
jgi:hypothetical protein|tara:strand:+ start:230 stop:415 length:186 start_codon:yes stop_codon:yes gene_type:complete